MGVFRNLFGNLISFFHIGGPDKPRIEANGANLESRSSDGSTLVPFRVGDSVGPDDAIKKSEAGIGSDGLRKAYTNFILASPANPFNVFGENANSFDPTVKIKFSSLQLHFQQNNAAKLSLRMKVYKWNGTLLTPELIFDLQSTISGLNQDYRSFGTATIQTPGAEVIDPSLGDKFYTVFSNIAESSGPKQAGNITFSISYDPQ